MSEICGIKKKKTYLHRRCPKDREKRSPMILTGSCMMIGWDGSTTREMGFPCERRDQGRSESQLGGAPSKAKIAGKSVGMRADGEAGGTQGSSRRRAEEGRLNRAPRGRSEEFFREWVLVAASREWRNGRDGTDWESRKKCRKYQSRPSALWTLSLLLSILPLGLAFPLSFADCSSKRLVVN